MGSSRELETKPVGISPQHSTKTGQLYHVHFTPTSASWLNAVEGLFGTLTKRRLKRGVFCSVIELNQAITEYLDAHNADPKPFQWTARADTIIAKHQRGKRLPESLH